MSVLVEFSIFPLDKGISLSEFVSKAVKAIKDSGVEYKLTAMGTIFETANTVSAFELIEKAYQSLANDSDRVYATIKMDINRKKDHALNSKIESVENLIGSVSK